MSLQIIRRAVITEKALQRANSENVYTFEVAKSADKTKIKAAIEAIFKVDVLAVNVVMRPKKKRRTGRKRLTSSIAKTKKALVKLADKQTIEVFDLGGEK